jgi:hypothetical protein
MTASFMDVVQKMPLPTIFIVAGILFWVLAIAGSVAGKIMVEPSHQKAAGLVGSVFIGVGLVLCFLLPLSNQGSAAASDSHSGLPPSNQGSAVASDSHSRKMVSLDVQANNPIGTPYMNESSSKPEKIRFNVTGLWSDIPCNYDSEPGVPKEAKCFHTASGDANFSNSNPNTPCSKYPLGSLIIMNDSHTECIKSGTEGTFDLEPRHSVYFLMNDVKDKYGDNTGFVEVKLSILQE